MSDTRITRTGYPTVIGTIGTVVLQPIPGGVLQRVITQGTYVGTVKFHDSPTAAGTNATSNKYEIGIPTTSIPQSIELGIISKRGWTYESTGTPSLVVVVE